MQAQVHCARARGMEDYICAPFALYNPQLYCVSRAMAFNKLSLDAVDLKDKRVLMR